MWPQSSSPMQGFLCQVPKKRHPGARAWLRPAGQMCWLLWIPHRSCCGDQTRAKCSWILLQIWVRMGSPLYGTKAWWICFCCVSGGALCGCGHSSAVMPGRLGVLCSCLGGVWPHSWDLTWGLMACSQTDLGLALPPSCTVPLCLVSSLPCACAGGILGHLSQMLVVSPIP